MAYVYRHIRLDKNEPFYIGIGSDDKGKYERAKDKNGRNNHWHNIIACTEYRIEIMLDDLTWEEANKKEIELVAFYGRRNLNKGTLCNLTDGGDSFNGLVFTDEHKNKLSKIRKEKFANGELKPNETTFKKGQEPWNKGKKMSKESVEKTASKNRGKKATKETREKLSECRKGDKNHFFNKAHTIESKNKMSKSIKNKYENGYINPSSRIVIDLETGFFYNSGKEAYELNIAYFKIGYFTFLHKLNGKSKNNTKFQYV
jgi:hypothetical protein